MNSFKVTQTAALLGTVILIFRHGAVAEPGTAVPPASAPSTTTNVIPSNSSPQKGPTLTPAISPTLNASNHPNLAPPFNPNFIPPARTNPPIDPNAPGPGTKPDDIHPPKRTNGFGGTNGFFRNPSQSNRANTNGFFRGAQTNGIPVGTPPTPILR